MADVFTKAKRSDVMSRIRGNGNKDTELALIRVFRAHHFTGWRRHQPVFGKPDFIFPKHRVAVFVDGCFWHGCPKHSTKPRTNAPFWERKLAANKRRDRLVSQTLRKTGWRVLRIWEHELTEGNRNRCLKRLRRFIEVAKDAAKGPLLKARKQSKSSG
jgi:DNA mismatch endonuclease, patch repair protein